MEKEFRFDVECRVLGAIMIEPKVYKQSNVSELLNEYVWQSSVNKEIFDAICKLKRAKKAADAIRVYDKLGGKYISHIGCVTRMVKSADDVNNDIIKLLSCDLVDDDRVVMESIGSDNTINCYDSNNVQVKFVKISPNAVAPSQANEGDAGFDLTATSAEFNGECMVYGTGLKFDIPSGYVGLIFPRSSVYKTRMIMENCVGVVDSGYRGEVKVMFNAVNINVTPKSLWNRLKFFLNPQKWKDFNYVSTRCFGDAYRVGDRVAQMVIVKLPNVCMQEVDELDENTERGNRGYGSSGR